MESSSSDSEEYYSFEEASDEEQNTDTNEGLTPNASSSSYKEEVSSTSEGKMEVKSSPPTSPDEVEFVVKNLVSVNKIRQLDYVCVNFDLIKTKSL